jgi:two-component system response regulator DctR
MSEQATIYLCDDDEDVLEGVSFLLRQSGFNVHSFQSGKDLLFAIESQIKPLRAIFVLDLDMPPMHGDLVHDALIARGHTMRSPVIFLSGRGTIAKAVNAVAKGALDFVEKPHTPDALLPLINRAIALEQKWNMDAKRCDFLKYLWESLTDRQREVALLVAAGEKNAVIAAKLNIAERTVEVHRSQAFEKLGVDAPATLATTIAAMKNCGIVVDP